MPLITPQSQRAGGNEKIKLGTGDLNFTTIASHGCTITDIAMAAGLPVREVNRRFIEHGVYASAVPGIANLVNWKRIEYAIPWLKWEWRGYAYDNDKVAAAILKNGFCLVEVDFDGTPRTDDKHWVLYIGGRQMIDPWTGTIRPTSSYGIATGYSIINKVGNPPEGNTMPNTIAIDIPTWERVRGNSESYDKVTDELGLARNANGDEAKAMIQKLKKDLSEAQKPTTPPTGSLPAGLLTKADLEGAVLAIKENTETSLKKLSLKLS